MNNAHDVNKRLMIENNVINIIINMISNKISFDTWVSDNDEINISFVKSAFLYSAFPEAFESGSLSTNEVMKARRLRLRLCLPTPISILFNYSNITLNSTPDERRCGELIRSNIASKLRIMKVSEKLFMSHKEV